MADFPSRESKSVDPREMPMCHVLGWLMEVCQHPQTARDDVTHEWLRWLCGTISYETGLRIADIQQFAYAVANGLPADGSLPLPPRGYVDPAFPCPPYGARPRRDVSDVGAGLAELDKKGRTAGLLAEMRRGWPLFDDAVRAARGLKPLMTLAEANDKAMLLAKADPSFVKRSLREWAKAIGCAEGQVSNLPLWQKTMQRTGRGKKGKTPAPKVVTFTKNLEAVTPDEKSSSEPVDQLIDNEDAARAKARWEARSPNRRWEDLPPEEQQREIAALPAGDAELKRLVAQQKAAQRADKCPQRKRW